MYTVVELYFKEDLRVPFPNIKTQHMKSISQVRFRMIDLNNSKMSLICDYFSGLIGGFFITLVQMVCLGFRVTFPLSQGWQSGFIITRKPLHFCFLPESLGHFSHTTSYKELVIPLQMEINGKIAFNNGLFRILQVSKCWIRRKLCNWKT